MIRELEALDGDYLAPAREEISARQEALEEKRREYRDQAQRVEQIEKGAEVLEISFPGEATEDEEGFIAGWREERERLGGLGEEVEALEARTSGGKKLEALLGSLSVLREVIGVSQELWEEDPEGFGVRVRIRSFLRGDGETKTKKELFRLIREAAVGILRREGSLPEPSLISRLRELAREQRIPVSLISPALKGISPRDEELVFGWCSNALPDLRQERGGFTVWMTRGALLSEGTMFFPGLRKKEFGELMRETIGEILKNAERPLRAEEIHQAIIQRERLKCCSLALIRNFLAYPHLLPGPVIREAGRGTRRGRRILYWVEEEN